MDDGEDEEEIDEEGNIKGEGKMNIEKRFTTTMKWTRCVVDVVAFVDAFGSVLGLVLE